MNISYDVFAGAFLGKITEYEFLHLYEDDRADIIDGLMKRAATAFQFNCKYDLTKYDDVTREFTDDFAEEDVDEIVNIISEGMLVQWMKQFVYHQEILEGVLNTRDYTTYSPAEMIYRLNTAYNTAKRDYTQMIREYSYTTGDLSVLHL